MKTNYHFLHRTNSNESAGLEIPQPRKVCNIVKTVVPKGRTPLWSAKGRERGKLSAHFYFPSLPRPGTQDSHHQESRPLHGDPLGRSNTGSLRFTDFLSLCACSEISLTHPVLFLIPRKSHCPRMRA